MMTLALIPDFVNRHLGWYLFGAILIAGLGAGLRDILKLSFKRIWAISGVCYSESIRRRILLITPLAILGIVIVSQLQRPLDEQDAIRQTIKIALFATGLLVAVATIILACTNLPREIDNRVIYTIVTKPTTRLEIVLGKVIGFARVSLVVLIIMGVFTFGYLKFRDWSMQRDIATRLESKDLPASSIATLQYYHDAGLLNAKTLETPDQLQIFARLPEASDSRRYVFGNGEGSFLVPFDVTPEMLTPSAGKEPGEAGILVVAHIGYSKLASKGKVDAATKPAPTTSPTTVPYYGPFIMSPEQRAALMSGTKPSTTPTISIDVSDSNQNTIGGAMPFPPLKTIELNEAGSLNEVRAIIDTKIAKQMHGRIYIRISASSPDVEYFIDPKVSAPVAMAVADEVNGQRVWKEIPQARDPRHADKPADILFQTRPGTSGQQLRGGSDRTPVAIYHFESSAFSQVGEGEAPFELRTAVERSGDEMPETASEQPTRVSISVRNLTTGQTSAPTVVQPESNRTLLFTVPAAALSGGNFEVLVRCLTAGDFLGLQPRSLVLITSRQAFAWNLTKSLLILWLMSILMTTIAIFASTFLSWPIAVVLTIVILLGHWGVEQLGDATAPGVGAQVVTDFGLKNAAKAEAVRATVEKLSSFLNFISTIMPDISKFPAVEDIERGIAVPPIKLGEAAGVTFGFGLPLVLLAYLILKNKEVAP